MSFSLRTFFLFSLLLLLFFSSVYSHGGSSDDDDTDTDSDTNSDTHNHNLRSKSLILAKVWCLIVIFFATFIAGVSPYVLRWNEGFLILGTQFAGGVFLGTALMHFLSDANETFGDLTKKEYPFAFMLACAGYLITMLADCVISSLLEKPHGAADVEGQGADKGRSNGVTSQSEYQGSSDTNDRDRASSTSIGDTVYIFIYVYIIALCAHSVFEGLAIGVSETKADAWKALWTICLHKIFAAIAMGIALLRMVPNRPLLSVAAYAFAFAISSPIGVAIGIVLDSTTEGHVADWTFAISMGLACGVFIYVSINHLFAKGYVAHKHSKVDTPYMKFLAVSLGIGVIAVVMIWDT
ncbi:zinc transporter 11-like protein [Trifolium pratense]|uniref:Zinc transporter 11-like protein n=1 Tax=Trifolium pratense TaxID=57577 RepID=A0A2K3NCZ9_TRIPR|nr:zinc transporter 11-like protein [Trifolium pratense]